MWAVYMKPEVFPVEQSQPALSPLGFAHSMAEEGEREEEGTGSKSAINKQGYLLTWRAR